MNAATTNHTEVNIDEFLPDELEVIETLIDAHGLRDVLDCIAYICCEKADHINVSYNDGELAGRWADNGMAIKNLTLIPTEGGN